MKNKNMNENEWLTQTMYAFNEMMVRMKSGSSSLTPLETMMEIIHEMEENGELILPEIVSKR